jgi:hypothetical protein
MLILNNVFEGVKPRLSEHTDLIATFTLVKVTTNVVHLADGI